MARTALLGLHAMLLLALSIAPADARPSATVVGATAGQTAMVHDALAQFEAADLPLPRVVATFHAGYAACGGQRGRHQLVATGGSRVDVCADAPDDPDQRSTIVHELAHSWAAHALADADRDAFRRHRGLTTWNDQAAEWRHRATEHAAEVITWALVRHPILLVRIPDKSCDELAVAYEELTGRAPAEPAQCPVF